MGLDWDFVRITPEQRLRLLSEPSFELLETIHEEREQEGLGFWYCPDDVGEELPSFDNVYHLSLRTFYDELEDLMLLEGDDGPVLQWPLGEGGELLRLEDRLLTLIDPDEVRRLAPMMQTLLDDYLDQRFARQLELLEGPRKVELEELYPQLRTCFADLTHYVQSAATKEEYILWHYG